MNSPAISTLKNHVSAVVNLKERGLRALFDVTHLPGRDPNSDPDVPKASSSNKVNGLDYKRISQKALLREQFANSSEEEQEAYIYRLAS